MYQMWIMMEKRHHIWLHEFDREKPGMLFPQLFSTFPCVFWISFADVCLSAHSQILSFFYSKRSSYNTMSTVKLCTLSVSHMHRTFPFSLMCPTEYSNPLLPWCWFFLHFYLFFNPLMHWFHVYHSWITAVKLLKGSPSKLKIPVGRFKNVLLKAAQRMKAHPK